MGEVRSTLEDVKAGGKSPRTKLADVKDQLYDLVTVKKRDVEAEGSAMRLRNEAAVATLEVAIAAVKAAEKALESY